jgi:creatinine amidohydrolase
MTAPPVRHWQDLTTADFETLDVGRLIAVLPLGAIEQHGPHLPLATDRAIADGVLACVLEVLPDEVPAVILPTQPVGLSTEHGAFPGTLTASPGTLLNLWTEIGASVARAGVRKLVLFNSHGGQSKLAGLVAQQLRSEHGLLVVDYHCYRIWRDSPLFSEDERREGIHGGGIETSIMLALEPDKVRGKATKKFESATTGGAVPFAWEIQDLNPAGALGDASDADGERGRALIDAAARQFVDLLMEIDRLDPDKVLKDR